MFVISKPASIKARLKEKGLAKLIAPKITKILINTLQLGPRMVARSALQVLKANPITRVFSVLSLVVIDVVLFIRKKISRSQLAINVVYSATMLVGSTIGWNMGQRVADQLAFDFILGLGISLLFTMIAIQIANKTTSKVVSKVAKTDCEKGLEIANECGSSLRKDFANIDVKISKEQALEVFRLYPTKHEIYVKDLIENYSEETESATSDSSVTTS